MGRLKDKIAIVTGGSRGIGASIAESFAKEGAKVVIASRKQELLDEVATKINEKYPDSVYAKSCHTGKTEQIVALIDWAESEIGTPNVLINNAATNPYFGPMLSVSESAWDKTFDVNVKGYFEMSRQVIQRLLDKDLSGSILNVSSILGMAGAPLQGVYGMTKAAVISMTKTLAVELGSANIRVNAIAPGLVNTRLASAIVADPDLLKFFTERAPLGRYAEPEEMTGVAVFLASDESSFVTGQTFAIDGGLTIT